MNSLSLYSTSWVLGLKSCTMPCWIRTARLLHMPAGVCQLSYILLTENMTQPYVYMFIGVGRKRRGLALHPNRRWEKGLLRAITIPDMDLGSSTAISLYHCKLHGEESGYSNHRKRGPQKDVWKLQAVGRCCLIDLQTVAGPGCGQTFGVQSLGEQRRSCP